MAALILILAVGYLILGAAFLWLGNWAHKNDLILMLREKDIIVRCYTRDAEGNIVEYRALYGDKK